MMKKILLLSAVFIFFQLMSAGVAVAADDYCYCAGKQILNMGKDACCNAPDSEVCVWTKPNDPCLSGFNNTGNSVNLKNPLGVSSIPQLIGNIIRVSLGVVGSLALIMFIYGGFVWMLAAGNEQAVAKGKNILTWATIGLVVIFASYSLVKFILDSLTKSG